MFWMLSLALALLPTYLILRHFLKNDRYPEPTGVIMNTYFLGVGIIIPAVILALLLTRLIPEGLSPWALGAAAAFLSAAIPEEALKLLVLCRYCLRHRAFDEPMDGIVYGVTVSLGFATLENVLYVVKGGLSVAIARGLTAVPGHAFLGVIMGYYVGQAYVSTGATRRNFLWKAYLVPVLLHALYDWPLLALNAMAEIEAAAAILAFVMVLGVLAGEFVLARHVHRQYVHLQSLDEATD